LNLRRRANQWLKEFLFRNSENGMKIMSQTAGQPSDLVEIAKRNGDFRKNYGIFVGAFLYLHSLRAASGRSSSWTGLVLTVLCAALAWWLKLGWLPL